MKTTLFLTLAMLPLQALVASDFTRVQNTIALQIEGLVDYEGQITVFSLDPVRKGGAAAFQGYAILGSAELKEKADRDALLRALATSIRESDGDPFACFTPRHGLRFSKEGQRGEIVICFQCASSRAYGFRFKGFLQTASAQPIFDKFLGEKGVKLAAKPQAGAGQPTANSESKPEGGEKPQPEAKERFR